MGCENTGKYIAQLETMFIDVYGTEEAPKEDRVFMDHSNDSSVSRNNLYHRQKLFDTYSITVELFLIRFRLHQLIKKN